jgi:hypothetical protein
MKIVEPIQTQKVNSLQKAKHCMNSNSSSEAETTYGILLNIIDFCKSDNFGRDVTVQDILNENSTSDEIKSQVEKLVNKITELDGWIEKECDLELDLIVLTACFKKEESMEAFDKWLEQQEWTHN